MKSLKEYTVMLKAQINLIPRDKEAMYKAKHQEYQEKLEFYKKQLLRLTMELKGDEVGILAMD